MGWVTYASIRLKSTSTTRFRLLKTAKNASPTPQNTNLRQSQCTSGRGRAFTLPMVAFTLSGDRHFYLFDFLHRTVVNYIGISRSGKAPSDVLSSVLRTGGVSIRLPL